jgi:hypothetical protein
MQQEILNKSDLYVIRDLHPGDINFLLATWLRGLYYGDTWFSIIPKDIFMKSYHHIATGILAHPTTVIKIACLNDDPEVILGYAVLTEDETVLHWVFVKKAWRTIGICKSLVPSTVATVTHLTKTGIGMLSKRKGIVFNPFII